MKGICMQISYHHIYVVEFSFFTVLHIHMSRSQLDCDLKYVDRDLKYVDHDLKYVDGDLK